MGKLSVSPGEHISQRADPPSSSINVPAFLACCLLYCFPALPRGGNLLIGRIICCHPLKSHTIDQLGVGPRFGPSACRTRRWLFPRGCLQLSRRTARILHEILATTVDRVDRAMLCGGRFANSPARSEYDTRETAPLCSENCGRVRS